MSGDFERTQIVIAGRAVAVTSWCDLTTHFWNASAPAHCHMLAADEDAAAHSASRSLAIERVVRELKACFERQAQHNRDGEPISRAW